VRRVIIPVVIVLIGVAYWFAADSPPSERRPESPGKGTTASGFEETSPDVSRDGAASPDAAPPLELPADGLPVAGRVVSEDGRAIPGVEIRVWPRGDDWFAYRDLLRTESGPDGSFRVERVPRGRVRVRAYARFRQHAGVDTRAGDTEVRIVLAAAGEIRGELRLPSGWKLPPGHRIQLEYKCVRGPEHEDLIVNDPGDDSIDGLSFRLSSLPPGKYRVWARILDLGCGEVGGVEVRAGRTVETAIDITEGGVLAGLVTDGDGKPVPGALVAAVDQEWLTALSVLDERSALWNLGVRTRTDTSGRYRLVGLPDATYSLAVQAAGYRLAEAVGLVVPRKDDAPPIRLEPGGTLEFTIPEGEEGVFVYISLSNGTLDGRPDEVGRGRIDSVPPGEQTVVARGKGWNRMQDMTFVAGEVTRLEVRRPTGTANLTGTITRGGVPQADRQLRLRYTGENLWFSGRSDANGRYRFEKLPLGTPGVQVGRGRSWPAFQALKHLVKLRLGETVLDVELAVGRIRLRVVDEQTGEPLEARVKLSGRPAGRSETPEKLVVVHDMEPGLHELIVFSGGYGPRRISATAGKDPEPVRVAMAPASLLELTIVTEAGKPIGYPIVVIVDGDGWDLGDAAYDWSFVDDKTGKYRFRLARGTYSVRVSAEGFGSWREKIETPVPGGGIRIVLRKE